jgi:putative ABC transport system permease protein
MRPDDRDLDDEIRGHLALSIKERIDDGQDPETARLAALSEFGYVPAIRDSMRRVWYSRWLDAVVALVDDMRIGLRSLLRAKGFAVTIVVTLALGIGANAATFSVVRSVLLRPLVNRDQERLIYIRQSAPGIGAANLTFSVPELRDLRSRVNSIAAFGEFSTVDFALIGLGSEPRMVKAGVVNGSFFEVMGLRPVLGRLLQERDDGPEAAPVAVLTHRFWTTTLNQDPSVVGKTVRLGPRPTTIVGVLEPSVPYPADTEVIANMVTSPHHLGATMATNRTHRMTELFGRLAPGKSLEDARAEFRAVHASIVGAHSEAYSADANVQISLTPLRDQIAAPARTILIVLLAAAAVVFVIACLNLANLILARSVRREGELAVRAALGASRAALRRMLLAESLVLCGAGAALAIAMTRPFAVLVARYAAQFSVRALDVTVDSSVLWIGATLAMVAAMLLAYVPRLPSPHAPSGLGLASSAVRITPAANRRLRTFAIMQIACSFVLVAGAGILLTSLVAMRTTTTGYDTSRVLVVDIPTAATGFGVGDPRVLGFYEQARRRVSQLPGVAAVAVGSFAPWRDGHSMGPGVRFAVEGYTPENGEENPLARFRIVSPQFFATLGIPILAGRDFTDDDRAGSEPVVIVSGSVAQRMFPNGMALNRTMWWTDPYFARLLPRRIVGIVADVDDENIVEQPTLTVYHPVQQIGAAGRLFLRTAGDPYALVPAVRQVVRTISAQQPVERAATLDDIRAEVLAPERVNAFVMSGFAAVALLVAVVGVAGVLAFSVSARTHEFGVRLAVGSAPRHLVARVLWEGLGMALRGISAGAIGGYALARIASGLFDGTSIPGLWPIVGAALLLITAAIVASLVPAARAARVDVLQALRSE